MDRQHQIKTLHMITLALVAYPDASWDRITLYASQMGKNLDPPVTRADCRALAGVTIAELTHH